MIEMLLIYYLYIYKTWKVHIHKNNLYTRNMTGAFFESRRWMALKYRLNPLLDDKILDWTKLKEVADDNLKCI